MLMANEDTYTKLTTFNTIEHLNESVRQHGYNNELSKTEVLVLDVLAQYSCVYKGVSFLTKTNIGKLIGKSRRTVIRACNRLEELSIIRQYKLRRKSDGQQTSNAIVIQPVVTEQPNEAIGTQDAVDNDTPKSPSSLSKKELLHNTSSPADSSSPYVKPYVSFKNLIDDQKLRNKIYGVWLAHTSYLKNAYDSDVLLQTGIRAIMTTFKASNIRNKVGYFNGVLDRMLDRLHADSMANYYA